VCGPFYLEIFRASHIGKLERGLDEGPKRDWVIIGVMDDWRRVFP
jgi:hypothetical protein